MRTGEELGVPAGGCEEMLQFAAGLLVRPVENVLFDGIGLESFGEQCIVDVCSDGKPVITGFQQIAAVFFRPECQIPHGYGEGY